MASLLRRSKLWDSFVPPPGFERPRTAELKFLIFFASMYQANVWWHPAEVAVRVGSDNFDAARRLCLKLAVSGYLKTDFCRITHRDVSTGGYTLEHISPGRQAYDRRAADFVIGFGRDRRLIEARATGELLGMFRVAKQDRRAISTRIVEYLLEYPEPISASRLRLVIRAAGANSPFRSRLDKLVSQKRLVRCECESPESVWGYQLAATEWLKQETKRRKRVEREQAKKAKTQRKRRRTLKKKAKKRKRPSRRGALEL